MIDTILFDLDGTLIPMDQKEFENEYFRALAAKLVSLGYEKKAVVDAIWAGTYAMFQNDGRRTNREVFWNVFRGGIEGGEKVEAVMDDFYRGEFDAVRHVVRGGAESSLLVAALKAKNYRLVLATSPVFPLCAVETRLGWVGLQASDFEHITTYENSSFCKRSPAYYRAILEKTGAQPQRSLMVGNNIREDMTAVEAGIATFLVTDYLENPDGADPDSYPGGSFSDFIAFAETLPVL